MPQYFCRQPNGLYASFDMTMDDFEVQDLTTWEAFAFAFESMGRDDAERKVIRGVRDVPRHVASHAGPCGSGIDRWGEALVALEDVHGPERRELRQKIGEAPVEPFENLRVLDVEVERRIFGNDSVVLDGADEYTAPMGHSYVLHFATYPADTFEVIDNLRERGYRFRCEHPAIGAGDVDKTTVWFTSRDGVGAHATAETWCEAVCRAALRAIS